MPETAPVSAPLETRPLPAIGPVRLEAATALAPMAALTDTVFRRLVKRQGGSGFMITEMVSSEALTRRCPKARALLRYAPEERPIGGQIMGASPERMAEAARLIEDLGFDFVDVNMGCPARQIVSGGGGSALLRDLKLTGRILSAIRGAVRIPLTVKLRAGWSDECLNAPEAAAVAEAAGAALVTLHARTKTDAYRPGIRTELLAATTAAVSIPVFANGDIRDLETARAVLAASGCDGVMAGRGAVHNPWLFRELAGLVSPLTPMERARAFILEHFAILAEECEPRHMLYKLKTFSGWYSRGLMRGARLRERIQRLASVEEFRDAVEEFFASPEAAAPSEPLACSPGGRP
jgi:nifR3 family TIM-barrel protein